MTRPACGSSAWEMMMITVASGSRSARLRFVLGEQLLQQRQRLRVLQLQRLLRGFTLSQLFAEALQARIEFHDPRRQSTALRLANGLSRLGCCGGKWNAAEADRSDHGRSYDRAPGYDGRFRDRRPWVEHAFLDRVMHDLLER